MLATCSHFLLLVLSLLLEQCGNQEMTPKYFDWDEDALYNVEKTVFVDLKTKYDSVQHVKSRYKRKTSYQIGTIAFNIRMKYARLMHMNHINKLQKRNKTVMEMAKNASSCQRLYYDLKTIAESVLLYFKNMTIDDLPTGTPPINDTVDNNTVTTPAHPTHNGTTSATPPSSKRRFGARRNFIDRSRKARHTIFGHG